VFDVNDLLITKDQEEATIQCQNAAHGKIVLDLPFSTATLCNTLQHIAAQCREIEKFIIRQPPMQQTSTYCNTLQHTTLIGHKEYFIIRSFIILDSSAIIHDPPLPSQLSPLVL